MHIVEKNFKDFVSNYTDIKQFYIAYSGGVDSQVLLHLSSKYLKNTTALHVNHGISNNSFSWEDFCIKTSQNLNIPINVAHFKLKNEKSNLEEKARVLRYDFFEKNVKEDSAIMTGHHLDDQAETFMLRLMRGSGVDGLASMDNERLLSEKNNAKLIRPLLTVSKEEIIDYALLQGLTWVEDESNKVSDYDRNFIRNDVMPLLKTRWKNANKSIAKSATNCSNQKNKNKKNVDNILDKITVDENIIDLELFNKYEKQEKMDILRGFLKSKGKLMPSTKTLDTIIIEVCTNSKSTEQKFESSDYELRPYFSKLFFVEKNTKLDFSFTDENGNTLILEKTFDFSKLFYKGKERKLKEIFKLNNIPYWERKSYPVFLKDGEVFSLGDIKLTDEENCQKINICKKQK